jgi:adenylate kinase family enzyme
MGDLFREESKTNLEIRELMEQGTMINDDVVLELFKSLVTRDYPALLDGFPRNRLQALEAIKFFKGMGWRVLVIDISCDIEVIIERLLARGREDDQLSIMHKRNVAHKTLHPSVMAEVNSRHDVFDVIAVNGNHHMDVAFTNFLLGVLRLVDLLSLYDMPQPDVEFKVCTEEITVNHAVNRWLSGLLLYIESQKS